MRNIRMIAIDLGNTLLTDDNKITDKNIKAIEYAHNKGAIIVMATARMYSSTKYISKVIHADYGVFGNGSQIMNLHTKEIYYQKSINNTLVNKVIDYTRKHNLYLHIDLEYEEVSEIFDYFTKKHLTLNQKYPSKLKSNVKLVDDLKGYIKDKKVIKVIIASPDDLTNHIQNILNLTNKQLFLNEHNQNIYEEIIDKKYNYAEFGRCNTTKATGLKELATILNISSKQIMAIGDLENDIELLSSVGMPVVMKNAKDHIKKYASYITKNDNNESGVAEAIYKVLGGINNENCD